MDQMPRGPYPTDVTDKEWAVQEATGASVELAWVDQGDTGDDPATDASAHGISLAVVKLPEAKRGFVLPPRRWVAERTCAWLSRARRLARDDERLPQVAVGLHFAAFLSVIIHRVTSLVSG
jgi:transposase